MTLESILFSTAGVLRAPWRLLLFTLAFIAATLLLQYGAAPLFVGAFSMAGLRGQTVSSFIEVLAALLATWFALRYVDRKPWADVGLDRAAARPRNVSLGFLIGGLAIAIPIALLIATGWLDRAPATATTWAGPTTRITLLLLPAALAEELVTRGYLLTVFRDALNWRWSVAITSVAFGLLHLQNPGANAQSVILVALAGVFLATIRIATGSLYAAWAAHFAWNWVMAALFHAPVSGFAFELPAYRYVDAGPDWATGGSWGPESGIPAGLAMLIGTGLLLRHVSSRVERGNESLPRAAQDDDQRRSIDG